MNVPKSVGFAGRRPIWIKESRIERLSSEIEALARQDKGCERLMTVPGIGPIISSAAYRSAAIAICADVPEGKVADVLEGKVIGQCMKRHRHQEFIRFLNLIEARVSKKKMIYVIVDNYATHKHPDVMAWLERHRRFVFHFTPTSASWLNAIEGFFAKLTKKRLKRGVFQSLRELKETIHRFLDHTNANPKPFT